MIMIYSSRGRISQYQLNRRLGRTQNTSGCCGEDIYLLPLLRIELRFLSCPSGSLITIPTEPTPLRTVQIIAHFQTKEGNLAPPPPCFSGSYWYHSLNEKSFTNVHWILHTNKCTNCITYWLASPHTSLHWKQRTHKYMMLPHHS
jgi:hypothetical protein